eukprot:2320557-Pleurochrysis_carterae.AAC.1
MCLPIWRLSYASTYPPTYPPAYVPAYLPVDLRNRDDNLSASCAGRAQAGGDGADAAPDEAGGRGAADDARALAQRLAASAADGRARTHAHARAHAHTHTHTHAHAHTRALSRTHTHARTLA